AYEEQPPRRAMPASRRAVQQSGEPLDVEPMEDAAPQRRSQDLDDPW
ncbi:MAG TPA: photosystem reaction center subunit H, partial [Synechococcus sp. UBA8071]|nr:photosystem reaction center subunit H [Synechococcus sp. UBA8071]